MCIYSPSISCQHPECLYQNLHYNPSTFQSTNDIINSMYQILYSQNSQLRGIAEINHELSEKLEILIEKSAKVKNQSKDPVFEPKKKDNSHISRISLTEDYQYSIILAEEFPSILLKEKGFQIIIELNDKNFKRLQIPNHFKFQIELYTMETPSKLLEHNIHGKKILRGTVYAFTLDNWTVEFKNIVINEVSSHYPNDSLRIIIFHIGSDLIKPLIINNISVRARKNVK